MYTEDSFTICLSFVIVHLVPLSKSLGKKMLQVFSLPVKSITKPRDLRGIKKKTTTQDGIVIVSDTYTSRKDGASASTCEEFYE